MALRTRALALAAAAAAAMVASARPVPDVLPVRARGGKIHADLLAHESTHGLGRNSTVNIFQQKLYQSDPSSTVTFAQRWWQDASYFNGTGPIILYISGEGPASSSPGGYTAVLGQQLGALLLTMEHRWYGDSIPGGDISNSSLMQATLSVEDELADLAAFATYIRAQVAPKAGRLLIVGGSYAGAVSSWFRQKHPEIAYASWSSSGVVNAVFNFTAFDQQIVTDMLPTPGGGAGDLHCLNNMKAARAAAEAAWSDSSKRAAMLALFNTPSYFTQQDFLWMMADSGAMGPQYGYKAAMCALMTTPAADADPLTAFAEWTNTHYGTGFGGNCYYSTVCLSNPSYASQWAAGGRPWVWQTCSELAYWQAASNGSIRSSLLTLDYFVQQCKTAFGPNTYANTSAFNAAFGAATPNTTRVVALQGSDDPWQPAGVQRSLSPLYVADTAACDGCGHCGDLGSPSPTDSLAITAQRQFLSTYLTAWMTQ